MLYDQFAPLVCVREVPNEFQGPVPRLRLILTLLSSSAVVFLHVCRRTATSAKKDVCGSSHSWLDLNVREEVRGWVGSCLFIAFAGMGLRL